MKWTRNIIIGFGIFSLAFVSLLLSSSCYAIDDWSVTVNVNSDLTGFPDAGTFCHNSFSSLSGHACSDYNYLIFESNFSTFDCLQHYFIGFSAGGFNINFPGYSNKTIFEIKNYNRSGFYGVTFSNSSCLSADSYYKFTLTESYQPGAPLGSIFITENGTYDVTNYASASVNVPNTETVIQGDYHDDLVSIKVGIYICAGTILVLYFFYCIYRLIIRNSGVK